jgi:hypothetical protein
MKNIHILSTDKPSFIYRDIKGNFGFSKDWIEIPTGRINQHIYITSNEEIKEGDYWIYICPINGLDYGDNSNPIVKNNLPNSWFEKLHDKNNYKKIILTTDQDLIKNGVQYIDDEFLEWFVKNPSCEEVEVLYDYFQVDQNNPVFRGSTALVKQHKIIIPKEEPKQETLEEAAERLSELQEGTYTIQHKTTYKHGFQDGAKWQQERMYGEEEVRLMLSESFWASQEGYNITSNEIIEQFKKK